MRCLMWLFALIFMEELDWSFFVDNYGFWGFFYAYIIICWGEVVIYTWIVYKILRLKGVYFNDGKVSKM